MTKRRESVQATGMAVESERDPTEVQEFLERLASALTQGDGKTVATMWAVPATNRIVLAEVRWPHLDKRGKEVGEEHSTYALRREPDGGFKVNAVFMHGAFSEM